MKDSKKRVWGVEKEAHVRLDLEFNSRKVGNKGIQKWKSTEEMDYLVPSVLGRGSVLALRLPSVGRQVWG